MALEHFFPNAALLKTVAVMSMLARLKNTSTVSHQKQTRNKAPAPNATGKVLVTVPSAIEYILVTRWHGGRKRSKKRVCRCDERVGT